MIIIITIKNVPEPQKGLAKFRGCKFRGVVQHQNDGHFLLNVFMYCQQNRCIFKRWLIKIRGLKIIKIVPGPQKWLAKFRFCKFLRVTSNQYDRHCLLNVLVYFDQDVFLFIDLGDQYT